MARRGYGKKKSPFADLDQEFKDNVANMSDDEIKARVAEIFLNEEENQRQKKSDQDLAEKVSAARVAATKVVKENGAVDVPPGSGLTEKVVAAKFAEERVRIAKKTDEDLKSALQAVKFAGEGYREATKMNKLRIAYAHFILEGRGKA